MRFVKLKNKILFYLVVVSCCVLANYLLWRYRMQLYNLDTDYEREPLHDDQMILFGASLAITIGGALLLLAEIVRRRIKGSHGTRP